MAEEKDNVRDIMGNPKKNEVGSEGLIGKKIFIETITEGETVSIFVDWPTDGSFNDLQEVATTLQVAQHAIYNKIAEAIHFQQKGFPSQKPPWSPKRN